MLTSLPAVANDVNQQFFIRLVETECQVYQKLSEDRSTCVDKEEYNLSENLLSMMREFPFTLSQGNSMLTGHKGAARQSDLRLETAPETPGNSNTLILGPAIENSNFYQIKWSGNQNYCFWLWLRGMYLSSWNCLDETNHQWQFKKINNKFLILSHRIGENNSDNTHGLVSSNVGENTVVSRNRDLDDSFYFELNFVCPAQYKAAASGLGCVLDADTIVSAETFEILSNNAIYIKSAATGQMIGLDQETWNRNTMIKMVDFDPENIRHRLKLDPLPNDLYSVVFFHNQGRAVNVNSGSKKLLVWSSGDKGNNRFSFRLEDGFYKMEVTHHGNKCWQVLDSGEIGIAACVAGDLNQAFEIGLIEDLN